MHALRAKLRSAARPILIAILLVATLTFPASAAPVAQEQGPWSFGIIADTQWTKADDGWNPNGVAANIIKQVDQQFVAAGVKLVIAVGDTAETGSTVTLGTRALYAQQLYNAGIAFYPLRGNHEATEGDEYLQTGPIMRRVFPQIGTGANNNTPADITTSFIAPTTLANNPPAAKSGDVFSVGSDFSEPIEVNTANNSLSYAFRYRDATFVLLDQFNVNGEYLPSTISAQQPWIDATLANRPAQTHAFVFSHKNLLGGNHKDNLFGGPVVSSDPGDGYGVDLSKLTPAQTETLTAKQAAMNAFVASMQANKVDYVVTGHDHHHYQSIVTSPDGKSQTRQLIGQSDASKFYTPLLPVSANDTPLAQDLYRVGYYIVTVDGPRVTLDYYGDTVGGSDYGVKGRQFNFVKMSTTHYSLNGISNVVPQGGSYAMRDSTHRAGRLESGFVGTGMAILDGKNDSPAQTNYGKPLSREITTSWSGRADPALDSDILRLSGLSALDGQQTDTFALAMTYRGRVLADMRANPPALLTRDANGQWVNAVNGNIGGTPQFVLGAYNPAYGLGTYGIDPASRMVWATLNYNGEFAVGRLQ